MYRRRTVEAMQREHARREAAQAAQIRDLIDRIMYLTDRPWSPPPAELAQAPLTRDLYEDFSLPDMTVIDPVT